MGEQGSQEKTEDATPKRIREARNKGNVPKSRDLNTVFVLIVVVATLGLGIHLFYVEMRESMIFCLKLIEKDPLTLPDMHAAGKVLLISFAKMLTPVLLAGMISGTFVSYMQVGSIFATDPITPNFEKLNPIEGLKNMFKIVTLIELIKNMAKLSVVFFIAYKLIQEYKEDILLSMSINPIDAAALTGDILYQFFMKVCVIFLVIAAVDFGIQRWNFMKNMRMSKQEIKQEYKQDEGDPHVKGERRRMHREMAMGDAKKNVKRADAVVTNPTHVAVAILYDRNEMAAPEVLVKGQRNFAELIIQIAKEENVPIIRNIPLAWSLLQIDEGDAIPNDLFDPVAEVLCMVYEMKENRAAQKTPSPKKPQSFNPLG